MTFQCCLSFIMSRYFSKNNKFAQGKARRVLCGGAGGRCPGALGGLQEAPLTHTQGTWRPWRAKVAAWRWRPPGGSGQVQGRRGLRGRGGPGVGPRAGLRRHLVARPGAPGSPDPGGEAWRPGEKPPGRFQKRLGWVLEEALQERAQELICPPPGGAEPQRGRPGRGLRRSLPAAC